MPAFSFDPERVARAEARGWRAYYDRRWLRLLSLLVDLNQAQFHIPFPLSVLAAFHVVRASAAFAPADHDLAQVEAALVRFYRLARRYSGLAFAPAAAAAAELRYWEVHRRLSGRPDKTEFVEALTTLHSVLFGLSVAQARESAAWRAAANNRVDTITQHTSPDPETDWVRLEQELVECYRSLQRVMAGVAT